MILGIFCWFLFTQVINIGIIKGQSMEKTLYDGQYTISLKMIKPNRGDIVVIKAPDNPQLRYIKRVVGIGGDTIQVKNNQLYINGQLTKEPYLTPDAKTEDFILGDFTGRAHVPYGCYFVMGDNRSNSLDSRSFGYITPDNLESVVKFVIFPFQDFKTV
ncbi:signal peptidase I [Holzapfeliella floricola]|nr:signal peptidase I [Holzapfeliella floricola]